MALRILLAIELLLLLLLSFANESDDKKANAEDGGEKLQGEAYPCSGFDAIGNRTSGTLPCGHLKNGGTDNDAASLSLLPLVSVAS